MLYRPISFTLMNRLCWWKTGLNSHTFVYQAFNSAKSFSFSPRAAKVNSPVALPGGMDVYPTCTTMIVPLCSAKATLSKMCATRFVQTTSFSEKKTPKSCRSSLLSGLKVHDGRWRTNSQQWRLPTRLFEMSSDDLCLSSKSYILVGVEWNSPWCDCCVWSAHEFSCLAYLIDSCGKEPTNGISARTAIAWTWARRGLSERSKRSLAYLVISGCAASSIG